MKKFIALALAVLMAAAATTTAFAADETKTTDVTYTVNPTYTVTIPTGVTIDSSTKIGTATISASDVVVDKGQQVVVTLSGTTQTGDTHAQNFAVKTTEGAEITYTVKNGTKEVSVGDKILIVNPATAVDKGGSAELTLTVPGDITYAGTYTGTMTFTISVESV